MHEWARALSLLGLELLLVACLLQVAGRLIRLGNYRVAFLVASAALFGAAAGLAVVSLLSLIL